VEGAKDVVVPELLSAGQWADREFGAVDLGDRRLSRRAVQVAAAMAADPGASIPMQNRLWKQTKGAYRLFDHPRTTFESMAAPHWEQTRRLAAAGGTGGVVLMIQDTTNLDYTSHPATAGLGRFGKGPIWQSGQGMLLHSVLAVRPPPPTRPADVPEVLGLCFGELWCRAPELTPRERRARRNKYQKDWPDKESERWTRAVREVGPAPEGSLWVHVGDREADIFDLYEACAQAPTLGFAVRVTQARKAVAGHVADNGPLASKDRQKQQTLAQVARSMEAMGESTPAVRGKGDRPPRTARLKIAGGPVTVYSPWRRSRSAVPLKLWAVRVWEVDAPEGVEPIEWIILTSVPVKDLADARRVASWYALRWTIEEYHKCLKTGCRVESRQLESADRLRPLVAMACVVAVRLLQLKHQARAAPDAPALERVPRTHVHTLSAYLRKHVDRRITPAALTVRRFMHEVAKLGGFLGRKGDGEPGWQTLWLGWRQLELMILGRELADEVGHTSYG
jgi:hypothetical protein